MTTLMSPPPVSVWTPLLRRFSVPEYHRMIESGILKEDDRVELLEGFVVLKMPRNPLHDGTIQVASDRLRIALASGWTVRVQSAITLAESEPEPDIALVRGTGRDYLLHHPQAGDLGLVIAVAESTLASDRLTKGRIYAQAGIPIYWIVNLVDRLIEVYTQPSSGANPPAYAQRQDFLPGSDLPLILDGVGIAVVPVTELLP